MKLTSSVVQLAFNKKIETLWFMIAVTSRSFKDNSNLKSHRVPIPSIMNEKCSRTDVRSRKQKERQNQIMKF